MSGKCGREVTMRRSYRYAPAKLQLHRSNNPYHQGVGCKLSQDYSWSRLHPIPFRTPYHQSSRASLVTLPLNIGWDFLSTTANTFPFRTDAHKSPRLSHYLTTMVDTYFCTHSHAFQASPRFRGREERWWWRGGGKNLHPVFSPVWSNEAVQDSQGKSELTSYIKWPHLTEKQRAIYWSLVRKKQGIIWK